MVSVYRANLQAAETYAPDRIPIPIILLRAGEYEIDDNFLPNEAVITADPSLGWNHLADSVEIHVMPGNHFTMMTEPHVRALLDVFG
uniref:Uncharacterized protein n=1 Tax=Candidatus Kentrum sp. TUN TaxID=2126343 RepID=A0A450ZN78_9GAMM|nr:MAG: hypothetical protein BECKTUN1418D_GA0071000_10302 [Candidatus Kentron sp. TUN]